LKADSLPLSIHDPVTGLMVISGLLIVCISLPQHLESREALRFPALFFVLLICAVPGFAVFSDPKSILRAEHVLLMAPVYWLLLDPLQGRIEMVGDHSEEVYRSFLAIGVFLAGAWIAFTQRPWSVPAFVMLTTRAEAPSRFYFGVGVLAFTLGFLKYAIPANFDLGVMAEGLVAGRWGAAWGRGMLGGADAFVDHLSYFGYLLPPLTIVLALRLGWTDVRSILVGIGTLIMAGFLVQSGARRLVGLFFGIAAVVWFLGKPRVRLSTVIGLGFALFGLLFTLDKMLAYRNVGVLGALFDPNLTLRQLDDTDALVRVDDNFLRLVQTTAIFPDLHPYTTWRYALWVMVRPVPRLFWSGKPVNPGFDLPEFVGVTGASVSSSVIGELFMAGGFVAVGLGGWFYGRLARSLSHFLSITRTWSGLLIYSVGLLALFTGMRSMIELVLTSYVGLAWVVLVRLQNTFQNGPKHTSSFLP
jgi:hypothetical protein